MCGAERERLRKCVKKMNAERGNFLESEVECRRFHFESQGLTIDVLSEPWKGFVFLHGHS